MGKVKAWAEAEFEKSLATREQQAGFIGEIADGVGNPLHRGMVDSDEALAQFDKEFNDWLDAYEASFGDNL